MNILKVSDNEHVLDFKEPRYDDHGNQIHLYSSIIYLSPNDSPDNYIEVDRYEKHVADEGKLFDYKDADVRKQHLYQKEITVDRLVDSIDNYIQVDESQVS